MKKGQRVNLIHRRLWSESLEKEKGAPIEVYQVTQATQQDIWCGFRDSLIWIFSPMLRKKKSRLQCLKRTWHKNPKQTRKYFQPIYTEDYLYIYVEKKMFVKKKKTIPGELANDLINTCQKRFLKGYRIQRKMQNFISIQRNAIWHICFLFIKWARIK